LAALAVVWVLALVGFSTLIFVQERSPTKSHSLLASSAEEIEKLQKHVKELQSNINAISAKYDRLQRANKDNINNQKLRGVAAAAGGGGGGAPVIQANAKVQQPPQQPPAEAEEKEAPPPVYDSDTSPVPLVDPTVLTKMDIPFTGKTEKICPNRHDGDKEIIDRTIVWKEAKMGHPRILCLSYTLSKAHDNAVKNVRETWGRRCDGYIAMSDKTDRQIPSIDIKHEGAESYDNMWQKSRSIWLYVHKHHLHDFDYFIIGGDDLFVIMENLRKYLASDEIVVASEGGKQPLFLGRRFLPPKEKVS